MFTKWDMEIVRTIIEPMVSKQWFLNVQDMAADAVKAVENDDMMFWQRAGKILAAWLREP